MFRVRNRAFDEKFRKFFAYGGTAEARLPSILAANASMPPRCRVSHTSAVFDICLSMIGNAFYYGHIYISFDKACNVDK